MKVQEFFFDKNHPYDLSEKKTDHLEDLYVQTNESKYETISYKGDKEIGTIPKEIRMKISDDLV